MRAALDALAIAGKAGLVVAGFAKVEAALTRDKVVALIQPRTPRPDGVQARRNAAHAAGRGTVSSR